MAEYNLKTMEIYNQSGIDEAKKYLSTERHIKYPRCVISRLKNDVKNKYDKEQDKFLCLIESPFLELDELCINPSNGSDASFIRPVKNEVISSELFIQNELQQMLQSIAIEKLMLLTKYINLNQATRHCVFNKKSLELAGYNVEIN